MRAQRVACRRERLSHPCCGSIHSTASDASSREAARSNTRAAPARNHLPAYRIWLAESVLHGTTEERAECSDVADVDGTWTEPRPGRAAANASIATNSAPR